MRLGAFFAPFSRSYPSRLRALFAPLPIPIPSTRIVASLRPFSALGLPK